MTHGFDTSFLVAAEVAEHSEHAAARARLKALREAGDTFALTPQVLAEFVHVVTDAKRFSQPLAMNEALDRVEICTMLATTFRSAGISSVLTTNARDFATFAGFTLVAP